MGCSSGCFPILEKKNKEEKNEPINLTALQGHSPQLGGGWRGWAVLLPGAKGAEGTGSTGSGGRRGLVPSSLPATSSLPWLPKAALNQVNTLGCLQELSTQTAPAQLPTQATISHPLWAPAAKASRLLGAFVLQQVLFIRPGCVPGAGPVL